MLKIFTALQLRVMNSLDKEEGQTFAEYGLILAVVGVLLIVTLAAFRGSLTTVLNRVGTALTTGA
jgi:Flp pilus assembly pilin Flp